MAGTAGQSSYTVWYTVLGSELNGLDYPDSADIPLTMMVERLNSIDILFQGLITKLPLT